MRVVRIVGTALLVILGLGLVGAAVQFVQLGLPYLVIYLLGIENTDAMNALGCGIWLLGPMLVGAAICGVAGACRRLTYERAGVWVGVIAYPVLCVAMFVAAPSAGSWVGAIGYTSSFVAIPMSLGMGLVWLLMRIWSRRVASDGRCERAAGVDRVTGRAAPEPRWRPVP